MLVAKKHSISKLDKEKVVDVLIKPNDKHTDAELLELLNKLNADSIDQLAPGFISARVKQEMMPELEMISEVSVKSAYQMK